MRLLLDTCTFLWMISGARELSKPARTLLADAENDVYLSAVSDWEIALKHSLGRLPLPEAPERFVPAQRQSHRIETLPLDEESVLSLARLPALHQDPFDRMLVCQAIILGMTLLTPDPLISQYPVRVLW
ncbi:MAG: type II toxin-antitoxin system VapC family toxin [Acidobacteriota bacterium]